MELTRLNPPSDGEVSRLSWLFERNPTSTIFARLADAYLNLGDADAAVTVCRRGLRYRPSYVTGHLVLGRACIATDDRRGATDEFRKVLRLEPDNPAAVEYLAEIAEKSGAREEASNLYDLLKVINPFNSLFKDRAEAASTPGSDGEEADAPPPKPAKETADDDGVESEEFPFVSLTLARLYADQGHPGRAERVVRLVNPEEASDILDHLIDKAAN